MVPTGGCLRCAAHSPPSLCVFAGRTKRKGLTVVAGLDLFGVKLKDASKAFRKRFACSAAVVKGVLVGP